MGIVAIFINKYRNKKSEYEAAGVKINKIYYKLRDLYYKVKGTDRSNTAELELLENEYNELIKEFNKASISQQLIFSDWYAHYKFFVQLEIEWIEEQRPFNFRDKVPSLPRYLLYLIGIAIVAAIVWICLSANGVIR